MSGPVIAADDRGTGKMFDLDALAAKILERDRIRANDVRTYWLLTGLDLLAAKRQVGHGKFGDWCKEKLQYSIRKAERLMQAADLFGPMAESDKLSFLPPKSLAYQLSAPSFPKQLRDEIVLQLLAGDRTALGPAREAVKKHKAAAKAKPKEAHDTVEVERAAGQPGVELKQQAARAAALDFLTAELGHDLPQFLALAREAGPDGVLSMAVQRELQTRLQERSTLVEDGAGVVVNEPGAVDVNAVHASVVSVGEPPAASVPTNSDAKEYATGPFPDAVAADVPLPVPAIAPQAGSGKFGDLANVVKTFRAAQREPRPKFRQ